MITMWQYTENMWSTSSYGLFYVWLFKFRHKIYSEVTYSFLRDPSEQFIPFLVSPAGGELLLWGQIPSVSQVGNPPGLKRVWTPQPVPLAGEKVCVRKLGQMMFLESQIDESSRLFCVTVRCEKILKGCSVNHIWLKAESALRSVGLKSWPYTDSDASTGIKPFIGFRQGCYR